MTIMNTKESFSTSPCAEQVHMAERELSAFVNAVTELYGADQARLSVEDWLDEAESMEGPPRSGGRDWRMVTVAASARLAGRLNASRDHRTFLAAPAVTCVSTIPSADHFATGC